ncbi:hypothetical protein HPB51_025992 [Rhipicephalus microplus]|uniref:Uncharacterized protein n=1 Tax=Rhipicephalus microplus TaxID=6941 RepID=A0A9J6EDH5_RHIMP|nr:hypothetical protein HPB51_025992 [Rhipicephalus microplus]
MYRHHQSHSSRSNLRWAPQMDFKRGFIDEPPHPTTAAEQARDFSRTNGAGSYRVESSSGEGSRTVSHLSPAFAAYRADEMRRTVWNVARKVFNRAAEMRDQEETEAFTVLSAIDTKTFREGFVPTQQRQVCRNSCGWHTCWAATVQRFSRAANGSDSDDVSNDSCHNEVVTECVRKLDLLSRNKSLAFATTEAELKRICDHLTDAMECVNGFTRRCFNERQREIYRRLTSGAAQLIEDFCQEGSRFRLSECGAPFHHPDTSLALRRMQMLLLKSTIRSQMDGYKNCAKAAVLRRCNAEAAELAEDIIIKAGGYLVSTHCAGYRVDEPTCSSCSTRLVQTLSATLAALACCLVVSRRP